MWVACIHTQGRTYTHVHTRIFNAGPSIVHDHLTSFTTLINKISVFIIFLKFHFLEWFKGRGRISRIHPALHMHSLCLFQNLPPECYILCNNSWTYIGISYSPKIHSLPSHSLLAWHTLKLKKCIMTCTHHREDFPWSKLLCALLRHHVEVGMYGYLVIYILNEAVDR